MEQALSGARSLFCADAAIAVAAAAAAAAATAAAARQAVSASEASLSQKLSASEARLATQINEAQKRAEDVQTYAFRKTVKQLESMKDHLDTGDARALKIHNAQLGATMKSHELQMAAIKKALPAHTARGAAAPESKENKGVRRAPREQPLQQPVWRPV